jgi:hypothetical protein
MSLTVIDLFISTVLILYIVYIVDQVKLRPYHKLYFPIFKLIPLLVVSIFIFNENFCSRYCNIPLLIFLFGLALSYTFSHLNTQLIIANFEEEESFFSGKLPGLFKERKIFYTPKTDDKPTLKYEENNDDNCEVHPTSDFPQIKKSSIQSNVFSEDAIHTEVRTWDKGYGPQGLGDTKVSDHSKLGN